MGLSFGDENSAGSRDSHLPLGFGVGGVAVALSSLLQLQQAAEGKVNFLGQYQGIARRPLITTLV